MLEDIFNKTIDEPKFREFFKLIFLDEKIIEGIRLYLSVNDSES